MTYLEINQHLSQSDRFSPQPPTNLQKYKGGGKRKILDDPCSNLSKVKRIIFQGKHIISPAWMCSCSMTM